MPILTLHISENINAQVSNLMESGAGTLMFQSKAIIDEDTCDKLSIAYNDLIFSLAGDS